MSATQKLSPFLSMLLIGQGVLIELRRRKDVYVLFIFMGLFATGVLMAQMVGIKDASTATLLLNLGFALSALSAHILTLVLSARQIPDEIENRTLYPILAKPIERHHFVLGKWLSCSLCGIGTFFILFLIGWVTVPKMDDYNRVLLFQTLTLLPISITMISAFAISLSLIAPRAVNIVLVGLVYLMGDKLIGFLQAYTSRTAFKTPVEWLAAYVPNFSKLNLATRFTDGIGALSTGEFIGLLFYGVLFIALSLAIATEVFRRRAL